MARFRFSLAGLLRHRKQLERQEQRKVAEHQAWVKRLTDELHRMDAQRNSVVQEVRQHHLSGRLDISFLTAHRRYAAAMQRRAVEQARRIVAAQQALDDARTKLVEAARQRKIIEKLREKRYQEWLAQQERAAAVQLDEVGTQMASDSLSGQQSNRRC
ncbi:MAG: flagellar export protein FliJ [Phycisphaerae bacterium]|nr:flagellar export protein FliJ [Phycisphaerae bacterium]MDW8261610.1 flagellar export protein FliJ [Phycisphaerales bacterium]